LVGRREHRSRWSTGITRSAKSRMFSSPCRAACRRAELVAEYRGPSPLQLGDLQDVVCADDLIFT